jgi:hypothetical protein
MEALIDRRVVIALAIAGAILSAAASLLKVRGTVGERGARNLKYAGYACMLASMALFIAAGIRGPSA